MRAVAGRPHKIALYGATGYTGRLVAAELIRRGERPLLAGRDGVKLERLRAALGVDAPIAVAAVDNAGALRKIAASANVVLSCAGPFAQLGPPVVDAALAERAHYCDITGEIPFMLACAARDAEARAAGVALVNGVGFDVVPTDVAVRLACQGLGDIEDVELFLGVAHASPSQGTLRSGLAAADRGSARFENGRLVREPPAARVRKVELPQIGEKWVASVPWGDLASAPKTSGARNVRVYFAMRPGRARLLRWASPLAPLAMRLGGRALSRRLVARFPEGPSEAERARQLFGIRAEARAKDGRTRVALVWGKDPYGLTAVTATFAAQRLAQGGVQGWTTPALAFAPEEWLARLGEAGVGASVS